MCKSFINLLYLSVCLSQIYISVLFCTVFVVIQEIWSKVFNRIIIKLTRFKIEIIYKFLSNYISSAPIARHSIFILLLINIYNSVFIFIFLYGLLNYLIFYIQYNSQGLPVDLWSMFINIFSWIFFCFPIHEKSTFSITWQPLASQTLSNSICLFPFSAIPCESIIIKRGFFLK